MHLWDLWNGIINGMYLWYLWDGMVHSLCRTVGVYPCKMGLFMGFMGFFLFSAPGMFLFLRSSIFPDPVDRSQCSLEPVSDSLRERTPRLYNYFGLQYPIDVIVHTREQTRGQLIVLEWWWSIQLFCTMILNRCNSIHA